MSNAAAIVAAQRIRKERHLVAHLREQGATSSANATTLDGQRGLAQAALRGLLRHGAVQQTSGGGYWLDESAYDAMRAARRKRAFLIVGLMLVLGAVVMWAILARH